MNKGIRRIVSWTSDGFVDCHTGSSELQSVMDFFFTVGVKMNRGYLIIVLKSGSLMSRIGALSLLKARHLLMPLFARS